MTDSLFSLNGQVVVVTGGLGQLGRQFTRVLQDHGARVVVLDLPADGADRLSSGGVPGDAERIQYVSADVTDRSSLESALQSVLSRWGRIDGLINNAALDSPPGAPASENGPFEDYPEESWDRVLEVNLKGVFLCCQVFGGEMARRGGGSIVNISSIYGLVSPNQDIYEYRRVGGEQFYKPVAYAASKSGMLNLTRYLSTYWAKSGVRVNTLTLAGVFNSQDENFLREYTRRLPIGRMAKADEYNGAIIFLCSGASTYMTGANLVIDGGWTAW